MKLVNALSVPNVVPASPASGFASAYLDPTEQQITWKDSSGVVHTLLPQLGVTPAVADQSITSTATPGTLVTGSLVSFPANAIVSGIHVRVMLEYTASTASVNTSFAAHIGTAGTTADGIITSAIAITPNNAAPNFVWFDLTFRGTTSGYYTFRAMTNSTNVGPVGAAATAFTSTSASFFSLSMWSASAQTLTIHQCITEVLST